MSRPPESSGSSPGDKPAAGDTGSAGASAGGRSAGEPGPDPERAWRESFDAFERAIGGPLEAFMQSDEFADAAARFLKANASMQSEFEKGSQAWRQAWNLPGQEDVQELRSALDDIRRQLGEVAERLAAIEGKLG